MEHIDTVSKVVDETGKEAGVKNQLAKESLSTYVAPSSPVKWEIKPEVLNGSKEITLAVVNEIELPKKNQNFGSSALQRASGSRWYASQNLRRTNSILRKIQSEPSLIQSGLKKVLYFDNPAFNDTDRRRRRTSFADVVTEVIQEPIKGDIHPYGRGPLYQKTLGGEQTKIHSDEGKLFMWVVAMIIVLSVAIGVIVMSQMYQAKQLKSYDLTTNSTNEIG